MKKILLIGGGILLLVVIVAGSMMGGGKKAKEVYIEKAGKKTVSETVMASGEIQPLNKVNIQADVVARIIKLYFKEGDWVKKGQRLVDLEKDQYLLQRDQMQSTLEATKASLVMSEASLTEVRAKYERAKNLVAEKLLQEEQLESAEAAYKSAVARVDSSREDIKRTQKMLDEAEDRLTKTTIVSPMDGKVVNLAMKEGEVVVSGMGIPGSIVAIVADLAEILGEVDVVESEIAKVKLGMLARIEVDALPGKIFKGTVTEIAESATKVSDVSYFKVKIRLTEPGVALKPGMTAKAKIVIEEKAGVLVVPVQAVLEKDKKKYAFLAEGGDKKKKARKVDVTTGLSDNLNIEIVSGLKVGDPVVTGPSRVLKDLTDGFPLKEKKQDGGEKNKEKGEEEVKVEVN
jgi:HlyD family secretion protein